MFNYSRYSNRLMNLSLIQEIIISIIWLFFLLKKIHYLNKLNVVSLQWLNMVNQILFGKTFFAQNKIEYLSDIFFHDFLWYIQRILIILTWFTWHRIPLDFHWCFPINSIEITSIIMQIFRNRRRGEALFAGAERSRADGQGLAEREEMQLSSRARPTSARTDQTHEDTSSRSPVPHTWAYLQCHSHWSILPRFPLIYFFRYQFRELLFEVNCF